MKDKRTLRGLIVILILLVVGIAIMATNKFQYSVDYSKNVRLEIALGKTFEINDILEIAQNIYEKEEVIIQKAGPFQDTIAITVKGTTEEKNNEIINKINEKYETELTAEDITLYYNSNIRGREEIEKYLLVSVIAGVGILTFFGIRYKKLGIGKVLGSVVCVAVGTQILYLTLMSICNMPINNITIASGIAILIFCFMYLSANYEKVINKAE